jgi:ubiquitin
LIQGISDEGIGGDESVNMEKSIEEGIKEVVKQIIEEIVEEINMEEDTGDPSKLRRSDKDRKQTRKSLIYYHDLREMKDKRSEYKEKHRA